MRKMNIVVLNGSPRGGIGITAQSINFLLYKFPQHNIKIFDVGQEIKLIEKSKNKFYEILESVRLSDGVLWAFPVHFFLVPYQYKRFIEIIIERNKIDAFQGKYAATFSTSIHFYDHTAHNYIISICEDMGMKFVDSFSADMYDLLKEKERNKLVNFMNNFIESIERNIPTCKKSVPLSYSYLNDYMSQQTKTKINTIGKRIVVITDASTEDTNLNEMVKRFMGCFEDSIKIYNLNDIDIKGGCLGCLHCGFDNICSYDGQDEFPSFYRREINSADIIVFAGKIKDRYLSSKWKQFFDRSFFNTFVPTLRGKQIGFIISGPLNLLPHLREIFEAYIECHQANIAGFVTDFDTTSIDIDKLLEDLAIRLVKYSQKSYAKPSTFLGIGGMKILRDDTWGRLRFIFQSTYEFYKKHGIYDFPQKDLKSRLFNMFFIHLSRIPIIRRQLSRKISMHISDPHKRVLKKQSIIKHPK